MDTQKLNVSTFKNDLSASVVVFLVALPLCLGIALASNAPIISGLLTGIIGGVVIGALSGSHTSVSGPAAGLTAVIAAQIASLGSFETFLMAVVLAGIFQIILGVSRAGFVAAFFPTSVIKGLLAAIGFILILKQLPHLVGLDLDFEGEMAFAQHDNENTFSELLNMFSHFHVAAMTVGLSCFILLIAAERYKIARFIKIPPPLLIVLFGTLLGAAISAIAPSGVIEESHRVQVPVIASFFDISKILIMPNFNSIFNYDVWIAAVTLAAVASLETLLNLEAVDKLDPHQRKSPPNRELIAQGVGNTVLGLIGGLPATSVVIRSSINIHANAKSKNSAIFHGMLLLFCVVLLPLTLNQIPLSCLAAILIVTGAKLTSPKIFKLMWSQGANQFLPFAITFFAIVFTDLLLGVSIGLVTSMFFILRGNLKAPIRVVRELHLFGEIYRIILGNQLTFLNRAALKETLDSLEPNSQVVIDATETDYIDADVLDVIRDFQNDCAPKRSININAIGFKAAYTVGNAVQFVDYATFELQKNATPYQVLKALQEGNQRVREGKRLKRDLNRQIVATAEGQFPLAVILSCMDSRVPSELIFDQGIGDVFSVRMAGNVVSERVLGSLEYAARVCGAKLIVVMGHTKCGAIAAAYDSFRTKTSVVDTTGCHNLAAIVSDLHKVISNSRAQQMLHTTNATLHDIESHIVHENVYQSIRDITRRSATIKNLLLEKKIALVGCVYDITSGAVEFLPPENVEASTQPLVATLTPLDMPS